MTKQQQIIGALALDLKRVAMAKYYHSEKVADRFWQEIIKRKREVLDLDLPNYLDNLYDKIEKNTDKDNLLMYSVILQNYAGKQI